ncbi:MAG: formate--tetrahydrofolate ligase [Gemmatimonadaceae bacterium]|nr:formate--tetrahydrofolate ligase [Gemmatimonadaceae bacterium]
MLTDIQIAQQATLRRISDVAADLGLGADDLELYGRYKAKVPAELAAAPARGQLVLVTAINPTAAGEGKTTTTVGLSQALRRLGSNAVACIRQPSLGPVFGVKGGAAGGGYAQVLPMEDINLHFTGDFHAVSAAHALLAAMVDNAIHHGTARGLDPRRVSWPRAVDMNDRALRRVTIGLGGTANGVVREDRFVITSASEVMAVLALATDAADLEARLARMVVGFTPAGDPVRAGDLGAAGAMALLLKDAIKPNLVQTLEGGPAFVHAGPFANIAHGCSSLMATRAALGLADVVVTEGGFGSDLGAEKFFDIKCRTGGLSPAAAVLVASVRALKLHGGAAKETLSRPDVAAVERGLANLGRHIANVRQFGVPVIVALNVFGTDSAEERAAVVRYADAAGVQIAESDVFAAGGTGGEALARLVLTTIAQRTARFEPLYPSGQSVRASLEAIATRVYGADGVDVTPRAAKALDAIEQAGLGGVPVCVAKTQYSFSDDPTRLGAPTGFRLTIQDAYPAAGAGFVVALAGDIMTMPGLPRSPAAERMRLHTDGTIDGLF